MTEQTKECPMIRHGRYTSTMCGEPMELAHEEGSRRTWRCEEGHSRVQVKCCNKWFMIVYDADECSSCGQEFNLSGQCLARDWRSNTHEDGCDDGYPFDF